MPRKAVILGGIGRSGTSIVRDMVHTSDKAFSFGTLELKFFTEPYGLLDLYRALVTDYRIDKATLALKEFSTVMNVHMTNPDFHGQDSILSCFKGRDDDYSEIVSQFSHRLSGGFRYAPPVKERVFWSEATKLVEAMIGLAGGASDSIFVEKTPHNVFNPLPFEKLFGKPKFVWVIRDPAQIANSLVKMPWGPNDVEGACDWVSAAYIRFFATYDAVPALVLKYEDIIANPDASVSSIERHIGIKLRGAAALIEDQYKTPPEPSQEICKRLSGVRSAYNRFRQK